ncbi:aldehyde dehydrogenase [Lentilitoribacter sp. Alg239-R112]|uniref:aldehyde dehydrogenase n=1 Tax=Lentilitoribacter sp. Alg239-R112 TaxID=2305987 RepID=UPI0013A6C305|nr:aldehyde dehydrogenase [Lentilitoribacter sp. Alg239-R112]
MEQSAIDALSTNKVASQKHLIDGNAIASSDGGTMDVISPIDGSKLTTIARGTAEDMDRAIASAREAFVDGRWKDQPPAARKRVMHKWADLIEQNALELAVLGARDNGTEIAMALKAEPMSAAATIRYYGEAIDKKYGEIAPTAKDVLGMVTQEPVGVVGAIIPWNFPLMIGTWKIGPALAVGNSVVLKPAETASLTLIRLAELALEAGLPQGVLNVVTGEGGVVGEALGLSMDVDVLAFTGSGATGRRLLEYSARSNLKRVYLELGGKSPHIVFNEADDLAHIAKAVAGGIFRNSGQVCVAGSRLLVQDDIKEDFVNAVVKATTQMTPGNPLQLETKIGAVNSSNQLQQNLQAVAIATEDGGNVVFGGKRCLADTGGFYMEPTIVDGVKVSDRLFQKEVFGPVLSVTSFKDEQEAIMLANSTDYGLASGVWTSNISRAHRMIKSIRAGVVHVNTYGGADVTVPLGGVGQSGNGSDKSLHAIEKYTNLKTAWIQL